MNSKLPLFAIFPGLWVGFASLHAVTDVTITKTAPIEHLRPDGTTIVAAAADTFITVETKAPIEQIAPDGSVSGVCMSVPGAHYNFVKLGPVGVDGQPEIIVAVASGQQYRIAISATDYQPSPVVPSINAPSVNVTVAVTNVPPASSQSPAIESEVTTFLEDAGLTARFDRLMSKMSNPVTRRFNDEDVSNLQNFENQLASSDVRAKYRAIFVAAATKAYSQLTPDDLAAIKAFLVGPLAAANAAYEPATPAVPDSVQDKVAQNVKRNDYGANHPYDEIITQVHATFNQISLPVFTTSYVRSLPEEISAGEIDGIAEGLLSSPSFTGRDKEINSLADSAKKTPIKSKYQKDLDDQIAR